MAATHGSNLVVKQVNIGEPLDFSIETLGPCEFDSPFINDGKNFVDDANMISYYHFLEHMEEYRRKFGDPVPQFEVAGPRRKIYFDPSKTTCAVVNCGGLCPGLNNVIRAIVFTAGLYKVKNILGIPYGYEGLTPKFGHNLKILNEYSVSDIHTQGGTMLGSSRGPQNVSEMVSFLVENKIDILFTIGGDGTTRGALEISQELKRLGHKIAVVGIPKTIDNDINFVEKTFGFETAVMEAKRAIDSAHTEAKGAFNGISIVKLMGRDSGYIAAHTVLASMDVNICLVPEIDFDFEGPNGLFETVARRLQHKKHCVIAVAEGAGQKFFANAGQKDASGNVKHGDIGILLKDRISAHFREHPLRPVVKYIDPSYLIRSVPASAIDALFCLRLGQAAVHAAMAGKTAMMAGYWSRIFNHVPMHCAISTRRKIHPDSLLWESVLEVTRQPRNMVLKDL
ncbi:MAG: ATP-dependent 6-phosphofructokinase [Candidatus Cloacimonetes bacterium]|nr:ATP-dependent 6-phosphofructokinase [Candidatus Cloacimonadota bacterium]